MLRRSDRLNRGNEMLTSIPFLTKAGKTLPCQPPLRRGNMRVSMLHRLVSVAIARSEGSPVAAA